MSAPSRAAMCARNCRRCSTVSRMAGSRFSAKHGTIAQDGMGSHSPYAEALLEFLAARQEAIWQGP
jgi:hypothetical protein